MYIITYLYICTYIKYMYIFKIMQEMITFIYKITSVVKLSQATVEAKVESDGDHVLGASRR